MNSIIRIRLATLAIALAFSVLAAACGGGGGTVVTPPPPAGPFTNANLKGQYAFVTNGELFSAASGNTFNFARTGSFIADGAGNITAGIEDASTLDSGTTTASITAAGSSYTVNPDGTGVLTLIVNGSTLQFSIALTSSNDGLLVDFTNNVNEISTGSGNFYKQNPAFFLQSGINGNYAFDFSGIYPDGNENPTSLIGQFNSNGAGLLQTGTEDADVGGLLDFGQAASVNIAGSTYSADPANNSLATFGRGIATFNDASSGGLNPTFVFYIVDNTRVRFISSQASGLLVGDATAQTNIPTLPANINGGFVFALGGANLSVGGPLSRLGRFTATAGAISNVLVDTNTLKSSNDTSFTDTATNMANPGSMITIDTMGSGRGTITFRDPTQGIPYQFIFYLCTPTSGVIQDVSGSGIVADGSLTGQTGGPFSGTNITGTYAFNWSGQAFQTSGKVLDEEDVVGQVTASSLSLKGSANTNQFSAGPVVGDVATGTITLGGDGTGSTGRNTMAITLAQKGSTTVNFVTYPLSPGVLVFASADKTRVVTGILKSQPTNP